MKKLSETLEDMVSSRAPKEDEYINEADGLIYCAKCRTPRQHRFEIMSKVMTPFIMCQCQKEAYDKEQEEQAQIGRAHV